MRTYALDDKTAVFAFRAVVFLALVLFLVHSPRLERSFEWRPFALGAAYLATSLLLWRARAPVLNTPLAQGAAYLWDVGVVTALVYFSEGFDNELYLMYFLIMFMSGLMNQVRQSFLIGTVSSLVYAGLWARGKVAEDAALTNLLLRFAFFYVVAFFTAVMAERVRSGERRAKTLELKMALGRLANGGWGRELIESLDPGIDPDIAGSLRTVNSLIDNLARSLSRTVAQNDELREAATDALLQLAHEKERLAALREKAGTPGAPKNP